MRSVKPQEGEVEVAHRIRRILVVEDDTDAAFMLKTRLESAGYHVRTAVSEKVALSCATEEPLDLVILDLKLPDISGYEVCRRLRKRSSPWQVPVLMLTGMTEPIDQLRGFAFGADAYLTKPFDSGELLKTVDLLL